MLIEEEDTLWYINPRLGRTQLVLRQIARLKAPCSVAICYRSERDRKLLEELIEYYIPFGVEYHFVKTGDD